MKSFEKILVVGGIHGDEPTGVGVAGYFEKKRCNISGLVANKRAVKIGKRFIETDLNRSFNVSEPISLEEKLAKKISHLITKFNLIIDIHNTKASETTCAITVNEPNDTQVLLAEYFGFNKIVIMPPSGSLISQKPEMSISLEIAHDSMKIYSEKILIQKILDLQNINAERLKTNKKVFCFANKVLKITLQRLRLSKDSFANFRSLTELQKRKLRLGEGDYYPIFLKNEDEEVAFTLVKKWRKR